MGWIFPPLEVTVSCTRHLELWGKLKTADVQIRRFHSQPRPGENMNFAALHFLQRFGEELTGFCYIGSRRSAAVAG